jgi:hypothetical protein
MQLDKEFQPVFHLLEAQLVPPAERINSITDVRSIIRVGEIDVGHMPVTQDDLNTTSLIKWEKIQMMLQNNLSTSNQINDNGLEPVLQLPGGFGGAVVRTLSFCSCLKTILTLRYQSMKLEPSDLSFSFSRRERKVNWDLSDIYNIRGNWFSVLFIILFDKCQTPTRTSYLSLYSRTNILIFTK